MFLSEIEAFKLLYSAEFGKLKSHLTYTREYQVRGMDDCGDWEVRVCSKQRCIH